MSEASWRRDMATGKIKEHAMPYRATKFRNAARKAAQRAANVNARRDANIERSVRGGPGWKGAGR